MKFHILIALAALTITASAAPAAKLDAIPNRYIVMLKSTADHSTVSRALKAEIAQENAREDASSVTSELDREYKHAIKGFAGTFSPELLAKLKNNPNVASIVPDNIMTTMASQSNGPWGLRRISQRQGIGATFNYPDSAGSGVNVYVLDTGIKTDHPDFGGRARWGFSSDPSWPKTDDNGHGTHCAGTIASQTWGVAKRATVVAVKVMDKYGSGSTSSVIAGIEYVVSEARRLGKTVVANISLGGQKVDALNQAVKTAVEAGVVVVGAAGNEGQDACNVSPASEPSIITVGATNRRDERADFSNWGKCVDIFAPGVSITSTWGNGGTRDSDGTSMAAPHVAGAAALLLGVNAAVTPADIAAMLINKATPNVVRNHSGSPNRLLYVEP